MSDVVKWNERYREGPAPWDTGRPSVELQRVLNEEKIGPCRAIDLGCGTGSNSVWLAQQGFDVTGVDLAETAIERAQARAEQASVEVRFLVADLLQPPDLAGPYRFFFDRGCYHVVRKTDVAAYLDTLDRFTAPDVVGLVLAGNAREPREQGPPVVTEDEIRGELGKLFTLQWLREIRFDTCDDEKFLGWSCLVTKRR
jgi:methyl halide transferase